MTTSEFTPGPWGFKALSDKSVFEVRPRGGLSGYSAIARVKCDKRMGDDITREANARLIAASPELLDMLQLVTELLALHLDALEVDALATCDRARTLIRHVIGRAT